jgi:hypothetical protein
MSKVSKSCPICSTNYIITVVDRGRKAAYPSCWKCGLGAGREEVEAVSICLVTNPHLEGQELLDACEETWIEYLELLEAEKNQK